MFSSQFVFWTQNDTKQECAKSAKSCAQMNEKVFQSYLKTERAVLQQLVDLSNTELQKKEEKESKLKQFVEEADDVSTLELSDSSVQVKSKTELLNTEVCKFFEQYQDAGSEVKKACETGDLTENGKI